MGIVLCAGTLTACSAKHAEKPAPPPVAAPPPRAATPPPAPVGGTVGEETVTATATVRAVNMKTRHVTRFTIVAGPEVRDLAQVRKGDVLRVTYRESIAYQ
jgi:hypothetical protein